MSYAFVKQSQSSILSIRVESELEGDAYNTSTGEEGAGRSLELSGQSLTLENSGLMKDSVSKASGRINFLLLCKTP